MTTLPTPEQIAAFTDRARALEAWDARLSLLADHDRFREHSITLNSVSWKLSEALGDVPPGTDSIVSAGGLVNAERIIAELATAKAEVARLTALITAPDGSGIPEPLLLAMLAMANHAEGLDVADHELLDHHRTETYRTVAESVWSAARERVEELRTELAETRGVAAMNWDASAYHHGEWVKASAQRDEAWAWLPYEMRCTLTAKWAEQAAAVPAAAVPARLVPTTKAVRDEYHQALRAAHAHAEQRGIEITDDGPFAEFHREVCRIRKEAAPAPAPADERCCHRPAGTCHWGDCSAPRAAGHPLACPEHMETAARLKAKHDAERADTAPDAVPAAADLPCDGTCLRDDQTKPCGSCEAAADEAASEAAADRDGA